MFAWFTLLRQNSVSAWHFLSAVCKFFSCMLGMLPATTCLKCLFEHLASAIVFKTVNSLLEDGSIHVAFSPHLITQLMPDALNEIAKTANQDPTAMIGSLIWTCMELFASWRCLCSLTYMHRLLEYAQILYFVLLIFVGVTPHVFCFWTQIDQVGFAKLFTEFQFDNNVQWKCANDLSSAFPSTLALQASLKPNLYVATTTFALWFVSLVLKTRDLPQCVKTLGRIASELFECIFMQMYFVAIVLGIHGKLDLVTGIIFTLWYLVIAFLPNYKKCFQNRETVFRTILPCYFCPISHTIFSNPPTKPINKATLAALGYELQDRESEIMLICYGFLPGGCPEQNLHNTIFVFAIDFCVLLSFLTHAVFAKRKLADAYFENKLETLTNQPDAQAKKQLLQQIVTDVKQHDVSNILETLQKCYFCLRIINRLRTRGYVSF